MTSLDGRLPRFLTALFTVKPDTPNKRRSSTWESLRQQDDEERAREAAAKAKRDAVKAEKQRQARMTTMKSAPEPWLVKASELVKTRGTENYREAASILADLRDAIGGEAGNKIARKHAAHLVKKYPDPQCAKVLATQATAVGLVLPEVEMSPFGIDT